MAQINLRKMLITTLIILSFLITTSCTYQSKNEVNESISIIRTESSDIQNLGTGDYKYKLSSKFDGEIEWKIEFYEKGKLKDSKSFKESIQKGSEISLNLSIQILNSNTQSELFKNMNPNSLYVVLRDKNKEMLNFEYSLKQTEISDASVSVPSEINLVNGQEGSFLIMYGGNFETKPETNLNKNDENAMINHYDLYYTVKAYFKKV